MDVIDLLRIAGAEGASDLHLTVGRPPVLRVNGSLHTLKEMPVLTAGDVEEAMGQLASAADCQAFRDSHELDFAYTLPDVARLRCNAAMQRGTISLAIRLIPTGIPNFEDLNLPEVCRDLALRPRGLVVVSGPTGSGKSTTLAAMIGYLNQHESRRVVTIEDPIEYVHTSNNCAIIQRELGEDTKSFVQALRHVLRQDPDVILVGEMRDLETAAAVLMVAETGHLVMTTGHAPSAPQSIERIVDLFPPHERPLAQARLASLLLGIVCQTLVPASKEAGKGRIPAVEIMLANSAVRNLIREGKVYQLPNAIRTNSQSGMQLMDHSLVDLYTRGLISRDNLFNYCNDRAEVEKMRTDIRAGKAAMPFTPTAALPEPAPAAV